MQVACLGLIIKHVLKYSIYQLFLFPGAGVTKKNCVNEESLPEKSKGIHPQQTQQN